MSAPADDPAWDRAVGSTYGLRRIEVQAPDGRLRLFRLGRARAIANAPYLEYGGLDIDHAVIGDTMRERLFELLETERAAYVLIKSRDPLLSPGPQVEVDQHYVTFDLDLEAGIEALWTDALAAKTRNQIRKAQRQGFRAAFGGAELLDDFYRVIARCWRDLGTPAHDRALFAAISREFCERCRFHVLYNEATPIAAVLLLSIDDTLHHPFAGTINDYKSTSANNLLYWNIISDACDRGLKHFDMGRSGIDSGTYHYKRSWGAAPTGLHYHYLLAPGVVVPELDSRRLRLATTLWRYLPLRPATALGPRLIRYML